LHVYLDGRIEGTSRHNISVACSASDMAKP
jgi:hypothetical protein